MEALHISGLLTTRDSFGNDSSYVGARLSQTPQKTQGHALVMAVVFTFFLTLFGMAFYRFAETDVELVGSERHAIAAFYAAKAGLEKAAWILKDYRAIEQAGENLNPFSPAFYDGSHLPDFQNVAHLNQGILAPGGFELPRYFRINRVDARASPDNSQELMSCVRVQVLAALDLDDDGEAGVTGGSTDAQGFPIDPDDVNRKFEAIIGLPGSLGENLSAGAPVFNDQSGTEITSFPERYETLLTQDGYILAQESGFYYYQLDQEWYPGWNRYYYIFGRPIRRGGIELPSGLFDNDGRPQRAYFGGLDAREYEGNQVFNRDNDPTGGNEGRDIIHVNGDAKIQGVDFGRVDSNGNLLGCDWAMSDVTVISTGTLTARDIQCGNVGRITLIAQNILLVGDYDTRVNGIALAGQTITLDDREPGDFSGDCPHGVLKHSNPSDPLRYTAVFMGTLLAGTSIDLKNAGWSVLFDEKVINGLMYEDTSSPPPANPNPTRVYETAEDATFPADWIEQGGELETGQEAYTQQDIDDYAAAWWDTGGDETPHLMRIYQNPMWEPLSSLTPDKHDYGLEDELELDFQGIGIGLQDWSNYRALTFWMSLDNWKKVSGTRESIRMFFFRVRLQDDPDDNAYFGLSTDGYYLSNYHCGYDSIDSPADSVWRRVRIPLAGIDPDRSFDITTVDEIRFSLRGFELRWYNAILGRNQWIDYDPDSADDYGSQGKFVFHDGTDEYPVRFWRESATQHRLYYTTGDDAHDTATDPESDPNDEWIYWNPDPADPANMPPLYFEDQFNPNLRIDQIQLPGRPDSNATLEYGLPRCFRYAVTHLREYKTF